MNNEYVCTANSGSVNQSEAVKNGCEIAKTVKEFQVSFKFLETNPMKKKKCTFCSF